MAAKRSSSSRARSPSPKPRSRRVLKVAHGPAVLAKSTTRRFACDEQMNDPDHHARIPAGWRRPGSKTAELRQVPSENGYEVHVLTTRNGAAPVMDPASFAMLPSSVTVHRSFTAEPPFFLRQLVSSSRPRRRLGNPPGSPARDSTRLRIKTAGAGAEASAPRSRGCLGAVCHAHGKRDHPASLASGRSCRPRLPSPFS